MNNPINPYTSLPLFRRIEEQGVYRHAGAGMPCPNNRLPSMQFVIRGEAPGNIKAVLLKSTGESAVFFNRSYFDLLTDGDRYVASFSGGTFPSVACGHYYLCVLIGNLVLYTDWLNLIDVPESAFISATVGGASVTASFFSLNPPISESWEAFNPTTEVWDVIGTSATAPFDRSTYTQPVVPLRYRATTSEYTHQREYRWLFQDVPYLVGFPGSDAGQAAADVYCLEYWCDEDRFGVVFSRGHKQRLYVRGTFDTPVIDQQDVKDARPDGTQRLRSSVITPLEQLVFEGVPDYMVPVFEAAARHDHLTVQRVVDGVTLNAKQMEFEYAQGSDPLTVNGRLSFVNSIFYRPGNPTT